jgi:nucleoredoxin
MYAPSTSIVEELLGSSLLRSGEEEAHSTDACLGSSDIVGLYFARWDKPCRAFTRKLAESYKAAGATGVRRNMEIVFMAGDNEEVPFRDCFAEKPWLAHPLHETERRLRIARELSVVELPCLVLIDAKTGDAITKNGKPTSMDDLVKYKNPLLDVDSEGFSNLGFGRK